MVQTKRRIGLASSGGGYRASAFHLGTLKKLNELGILENIDVLSTISGGSITGAAWCLHSGDYPSFHKKMVETLQTKSVVRYVVSSWLFYRFILFAFICIIGACVLTFTSWSWLTSPLLIFFFWILIKYQYNLFPISRIIERAYDTFFFEGKKLKDLKVKPFLAIGSSNLHSGRPFTFSKAKMSDSSYVYRTEYNPPIEFKQLEFPVARAVMASSCVPHAFSPVTIDKEYFVTAGDFDKIKPVLVDGGVYDNQGIQKLTQPKSSYECEVIITSDAGANFIANKRYPNVIALLIRTVDLFMYRIKAVQMIQNVYRNANGAAKPIAYFSLGWRIENVIPGFVKNMCDGLVLKEVINAHGFAKEWIENPKLHMRDIEQHLEGQVDFQKIKENDLDEEHWQVAKNTVTGLSVLSENQIAYLIRQAENFTELQIKLYCPFLIKPLR